MKKECSVYLIDDDLSAQKGISRLLTSAGFNVYTYISANKFLASLSENIYGCLVIDVRMPGMSVEELYNVLLERRINLSILVISANDTAETRMIAKKINAKGFFRKPIDGNALVDAINWILKSETKENNHKSSL